MDQVERLKRRLELTRLHQQQLEMYRQILSGIREAMPAEAPVPDNTSKAPDTSSKEEEGERKRQERRKDRLSELELQELEAEWRFRMLEKQATTIADLQNRLVGQYGQECMEEIIALVLRALHQT